MPVEQGTNSITLKHPKGASAEILLYGATVVSWKSPAVSDNSNAIKERLFVSGKSALDGSKPVRGGIPICFPIFGPPSKAEYSSLAQHGFARSSIWKLDHVVLDNETGVSVKLALEPSDSIKSSFSYPFKLAYVVTLAEHQLSTDLHVTNPSQDATFSFQALLHTYYAAISKTVKVSPLKGLTYINKVKGGVEQVEERDFVEVTNFTDSVYKNASGKYIIDDGESKYELHSRHLNDVVVWNPRDEAGSKIADMEAGGWDRYVCVEPGAASYFIDLEPGKSWNGGQSITVL